MLRTNSLRAKLDAQPVVLGTFVEIPSPAVVEILGAAGFDFCVIDTEHGSFGLVETESMIRASASTGIAPVVRVASCDAVAVRQPRDMGAAGIHIPQVESARMGRDAIRYARFHPLGERGFQSYARAAAFGTQPTRDSPRRSHRA